MLLCNFRIAVIRPQCSILKTANSNYSGCYSHDEDKIG